MAVRLITAQDESRWEDYVKRTPGATFYHQLAWKAIIEKTFGHRCAYWLSEDSDGRMNGMLPLVQLKSALFGNFMVSLPYFTYGGLCADHEAARTDLLAAAITDAKAAGARHMELRQEVPLSAVYPVKTAKVSMRLPLPATADSLFKTFDAKLRSQIRRPAKDGMQARIGGVEELDAFYDVFSVNMRDLGTPVYSKTFFRSILTGFPGMSWICTVYQGVKPVASGLLLGFKEMLEIPWASSLSAYNRFSPNMLLYWTVLQFACEREFKIFDFGRSTRGEGTYRFKEQWGAEPVALYWHYWLRDGGPLPELNPKNPKYGAAITLWKRLPVAVTQWIGPSIVRNLP